ncbi:MAG: shikimate kinase [Bacteroidales bacterium]
MIIFLIGFMGSGKSTLGKRLAHKIDYPFLDMDEAVEKQADMTIADMFKKKGEDYFRRKENEFLQQLDTQQNLIVATGGGSPCFYNNIEIMNTKGITVYLKMTPSGLAYRLKQSRGDRPLLADIGDGDLEDYIDNKLKIREPFYVQSSCIIKGENVKPDHVIDLVFDRQQKKETPCRK